MRAILVVFCVALIAGALSHQRGPSSRSSRLRLPNFLGYFSSYFRQFILPDEEEHTEEEEEWGYEGGNGPSTWGRTFPNCAGARQSPIALDGSNVKLSNFNFLLTGYDKKVHCNLTNTGHTVVLTCDYGPDCPAPFLKFRIDNISAIYKFASMHFHSRSEHTMDGQRRALELHFVHILDTSSVADPSSVDSMLVLGYLFDFCDFRFGSYPPGMEAMADVMPWVREVNDTADFPTPMSPAQFMPYNLTRSDPACKFFLYPGSLTTPPCTESVTWLVYKPQVCITRSQLFRFRNLAQNSEHHPIANNYRPVQPLNGRIVQYKACNGQ